MRIETIRGQLQMKSCMSPKKVNAMILILTLTLKTVTLKTVTLIFSWNHFSPLSVQRTVNLM